MTQRSERELKERRDRAPSRLAGSLGPSSLKTTLRADPTLPSPSPVSDPTLPSPSRDRAVSGGPSAFDATIDASSRDPFTAPNSLGRLSLLAARLPGVRRDAYVVGDEVARGGIGRVVRARDERLDRPVAIKELLTWDGAQERRFIREALLTARLQHPAIVPVYEAGRWPDGEPFYAMKLVSGRTLSELIDERPTLAERLSLLSHVLTAAQAIAYAHSQRILHRDLKPANVLVGEFGETVVIDWGLAKGLNEADEVSSSSAATADNGGLTIAGSIMGTPAYMPPEQALGAAVDERADIYALGAMLYHLIASVPPYHEVPWERLLLTIATEGPRPILDHAPAISDELSAIVNKAMAREPSARYATAKELADDLHRFQTGQIVGAHTYSSRQLLARFWRRNKAALSSAGAALALIAVVVVVAFVRTDAERRFALAQQKEAQAASITAETERRAAEEAGQRATTRADELTILQAQGALDHDPNAAVAWLKTLSPSFADAAALRRLAADARARGISRAFRGHTAYVNHVAISSDGRGFITTSDDRTLRIWDVATAESRALTGHTDEVWLAAALPDGKRVASASKDNTLRIWDTHTGALLAQAALPAPCGQLIARADGSIIGASLGAGPAWTWTAGSPDVHLLAEPSEEIVGSTLSEDGRALMSQRKDGTIFVLDVAAGRSRQLGRGPQKRGVWMLSPNARYSVSWRPNNTRTAVEFELWDLDSGVSRAISTPARDPMGGFSHNSELFAVAYNESIDVYDLKTRALLRRFPGFGSDVRSTQFSDDDKILAIGSYDQSVHMLDLSTGESSAHLGLKGAVSALSFLPKKHELIAASALGDVRLFAPPRDGAVLTTHAAPSYGLAVAPDGHTASIDDDGLLRITDAEGNVTAEHKLPPAPSRVLYNSPDKRRFAGAEIAWGDGEEGVARPSEGKNGVLLLGSVDRVKPTLIPTPSMIRGVAWSPSGDSLFVGQLDGSVMRVAVFDGSLSAVTKLPAEVAGIAVSPDGSQLAVTDTKGLVRLVDPKTGVARDLGKHMKPVNAVAFSRAGDLLATGSLDHTARIWRLSDGTFKSIDASGAGVKQLEFSRDGKTLFTLSAEETLLRRWSVESGEALAPLGGHQGTLIRFVLSDDGARLVTTSFDRTARLFDVATGESRELRDLAAPVVDAAFARDGKLIVTLNHSGTVRAFPDNLPEGMPELRAWLAAATPDRIDKR